MYGTPYLSSRSASSGSTRLATTVVLAVPRLLQLADDLVVADRDFVDAALGEHLLELAVGHDFQRSRLLPPVLHERHRDQREHQVAEVELRPLFHRSHRLVAGRAQILTQVKPPWRCARFHARMASYADENQQIAAQLREASDLLQAQGANPFRVGAYRRAADSVARFERPVRELFDASGRAGLQAIFGVGSGISSAIAEMLITGSWGQLARLRGAAEPEALFRTVPGIGEELAHAIHEELQVDTLEGLEIAAHDGRLEGVSSVGPRRAAAIRASLAAMLGRRLARAPRAPSPEAPDVATLLDVDREYRAKAAAGKLAAIAPKRFNPQAKAWLPILHTRRGAWHFTALYSNTARAHELGKTHDWVVIYFYDGDHREQQCTVVTETRGAAAGQRVVRGREAQSQSIKQRRSA